MTKKKFFYILLSFFVIADIILAFIYLGMSRRQNLESSLSFEEENKQTVLTPTVDPQQIEKLRLTPNVTVVDEPYEFEVVSTPAGESSASEVLLKGNQGEFILRDDPKLHIFYGVPPNATAATFADLKVGQKLNVKAVSPEREVWVYIVD